VVEVITAYPGSSFAKQAQEAMDALDVKK